MSILEIILYILLGGATLTWAIIVIVKAIKKKKIKKIDTNEDEN